MKVMSRIKIKKLKNKNLIKAQCQIMIKEVCQK
jgi:hypothetical protein